MRMKRFMLKDSKALILAIAIVVVFAPSASAYNLEEYYPLHQGNSWTYSVIEDGDIFEETVRIEGKEIIEGVETVRMVDVEDEDEDENDYRCVAIDSEGIKEYKYFDAELNGDSEYEIPDPPKLIFPNIEIGENKKYSINLIAYDLEGAKTGERSSESGQILLDSVEDLEVPAGKFRDCLKFSSISEWKEPDGSFDRDDCTIWLAPGVGKIKEFCFNIEYDAEAEETSTESEIYELISAVVDGVKIEPK